MKTYLHLLLFALFFVSCKESQPLDPESKTQENVDSLGSKTALATVKSVSWDVGVIHKLEFFYNNDSTLNYYLSGSSNLSSKYKTQFNYSANLMDGLRFDDSSHSKFIYGDSGKVKVLRNFNAGVETSRKIYTYNQDGRIVQVENRVAVNEELRTSWKSAITYDAQGNLNRTDTYTFDTNSQPLDTIIREINELSVPVKVNPYSLLHPLYQHQAHEIFDAVVLSRLTRLPRKIKETGRKEVGPLMYEYLYSISNQLLEKLKCRIAIGDHPSYDTAEAIFSY
jgi:hypothetical protein